MEIFPGQECFFILNSHKRTRKKWLERAHLYTAKRLQNNVTDQLQKKRKNSLGFESSRYPFQT